MNPRSELSRLLYNGRSVILIKFPDPRFIFNGVESYSPLCFRKGSRLIGFMVLRGVSQIRDSSIIRQLCGAFYADIVFCFGDFYSLDSCELDVCDQPIENDKSRVIGVRTIQWLMDQIPSDSRPIIV